MLKKIGTAITAVILLVTPVAVAGPASADTPGCVTRYEYSQVLKGTRMSRAHRIFDTSGWFIDGGAGGFARGYRFCARAQRLANTTNFKIIYVSDIRDGQVVSNRVSLKYCGPDYYYRRRCF